jgi:hypothetical protein
MVGILFYGFQMRCNNCWVVHIIDIPQSKKKHDIILNEDANSRNHYYYHRII